VTRSIDLRVGESVLAHYRATSLSDRRTVGTATFNVTPLAAGQYFNKVECFCFTEQQLAAGESADLPVSFFIDPEIELDRDLDGVRTITLSYTYFPVAAGGEQTSLDAAGTAGQAKVN
jgi:cytochrome c oxidase assembly protein subunit 11